MNLGKKEYLKVLFKCQGHPSKGCGSSRPFHRSRRIRIRFDGHSSGRCRCEQLPDGNGAAGRYCRRLLVDLPCLRIQIVGPPPPGPTASAVLLAPVTVAPRPFFLLWGWAVAGGVLYTDKKNQIFLIYKEIQDGAISKSYCIWLTDGLLIYGEIIEHFLIYILGSPSWYMTLQLLHSEFPYIWGKFDFLFYQCRA